jgi:hypothetical protein
VTTAMKTIEVKVGRTISAPPGPGGVELSRFPRVAMLLHQGGRSVSWVSRRLALVELLPESIQQQVREGKPGAQLAMKYLVRWRASA